MLWLALCVCFWFCASRWGAACLPLWLSIFWAYHLCSTLVYLLLIFGMTFVLALLNQKKQMPCQTNMLHALPKTKPCWKCQAWMWTKENTSPSESGKKDIFRSSPGIMRPLFYRILTHQIMAECLTFNTTSLCKMFRFSLGVVYRS